MITFSPRLKCPVVSSKIIQINMEIGEHINFMTTHTEFLNLSESAVLVNEIANRFMRENKVMEVYYKRRVPWSKVISQHIKGKIYANKKFINSNTDIDYIAGNLGHEAAHFLGYDHSPDFSPSRKFNHVYYFGYLIRYLFNCRMVGDSPSLESWKSFIKEID